MSTFHIILLIYFATAINTWIYWRIYYSKNGRGHDKTPNEDGDNIEIWSVIVPVFNLFGWIAWFAEPPFKPSENHRERNFTERFLMTKKKPK